jgi:Spherulation-specific family 4
LSSRGPLIALACGVLAGCGATATPRSNQLIPLYDNANPVQWQTACSQSNGSNGGSYVIADPSETNGPGQGPVPAFSKVIHNCRRYGKASVIGYVWTDYGRGGSTGLMAIEEQVRAWYAYYPGDVAGIFFDGASDTVPGTNASNVSFYRTLASYVHAYEGQNQRVVLNFGSNPSSGWMLSGDEMENADIVVTFEGSYDTPDSSSYTAWTQASWELRYPARDFAALVHDARNARACTSLVRQHLGYAYVCSSYSSLPPYWNEFLRAC